MSKRPALFMFAVGLAVAGFGWAGPAGAVDRTPPAAHRALYALTLETARSSGDVEAARGTMAYEVTDACDGWATCQRLALFITNRDGQEIELISDYTTWESKDGLRLRFRMRQTTDTALTDQAEGEAVLNGPGEGGVIRYTKPEEKEMAMPKGTVFPMAHTDMILAAAEAGKKFITIPIFDGTGDKGAQDSSIAIINWAGPGPAPFPALAPLGNGRVRIAFFDRRVKEDADKPYGSPDYEVGMRYWANGVADELHMDFSDFVMLGRLKDLSFEPPHC